MTTKIPKTRHKRKRKPPNPKGVGGFKPGHTLSVGRRNPTRPDFLLQGLISQLNELKRGDPANRPKFAVIIDVLIAQAIKGNLHATQIIFDQVQGRPRQQVTLEAPGGLIRIERIENIIVRPGIDDPSIRSRTRIIDVAAGTGGDPAVCSTGSIRASPEASEVQGGERREE